MKNEFLSRKFLSLVGFVLLVVGNSIFALGISEAMLFTIAAAGGIYQVANVAQKVLVPTQEASTESELVDSPLPVKDCECMKQDYNA